jgi:hypothetical protein
MNSGSEPALDLLEKYFLSATNHTPQQVDRWSGDYSLTVLDEAMKRIADKFGAISSPDLAKKYPSGITYKTVLDDIIFAIGMKTLGFKKIRAPEDFTLDYGMPPPPIVPSPSSAATATSASGATQTASGTSGTSNNSSSAQGGVNTSGAAPTPQSPPGTGGASSTATVNTAGSSSSSAPATTKVAASPINDEKSVRRALKSLKPLGQNRAKLVTLKIEAGKLKLKDNPIAFCFLLRSMFEIAGKAYCEDHAAAGGPTAKKDGKDKTLLTLLRDITAHLTQNSTDQAMLKKLHGALTQLAKQDGILSITSMNQLVHNPSFTITDSEICSLFANVFPLMEEMNR